MRSGPDVSFGLTGEAILLEPSGLAFRFRQPKNSRDQAEEAETAPYEPSLAPQVPSKGIEQGWVQEIGADAGNIVHIPANDDRLNLEALGGASKEAPLQACIRNDQW